MMEVLFNHYIAKVYQQVGRIFFYPETDSKKCRPINSSFIALAGFFSSFRPISKDGGKLALNVDGMCFIFYC